MKYRNTKTAISQKWVKTILQQIFAFFYSTLLSTSVSRRMGYFIHYYIILIFVNFYLHVTTAYILQSEEIDVAETSDGHGCHMGTAIKQSVRVPGCQKIANVGGLNRSDTGRFIAVPV